MTIGAALCFAVLLGLVSQLLMNRGVIRELREDPAGERAQKVMLLSLPSGKEIPVNYLREGDRVFAAADFPWWRELRSPGAEVKTLIQGEVLVGLARAIEDDPQLRERVFSQLRPTAPSFTGTLIQVQLR